MTVNLTTNLTSKLSLETQNLNGPGPISQSSAIAANPQIQDLNALRNDLVDYIRLRLGDGIVDVELDKEHYEMAIKQALIKYRQRAPNAVEESYAFLDLQQETQEYILPPYIMEVRAAYRRGIGSVSGTTASQFEPFASGYLNTYMLVAGRVGGLTNYELFVDYQKLAMKMFGGFMNFTWNRVTKKLTLIRKIPNYGTTYLTKNSITANGTAPGSTITIVFPERNILRVGDPLFITNCPFEGYNYQYTVATVSADGLTYTVTAANTLETTSITGFDLSRTRISSPTIDANSSSESVLLQIYNYKPDSLLLSDPQVLPWIQDYALAFAKSILGQARGKFASIAGPQGGTQLNGAQLIQEAQAEMEKLEDDLQKYVDGSAPLTWVTG